VEDEMTRGFQVGDWLADPSVGSLSRGTESVTLRPREMDLLVYLAGHPGEVVTADELLDSVWQGVVVGTDSVYFVISQLRKALDDDKRAPVYIETIPKRGYRLIADVAFLSDEPDVIATPASPAPDTTGSQQIFTGSKLTAT
jgi:DNA-binding winged helix-turn-helix (wHTH) protein